MQIGLTTHCELAPLLLGGSILHTKRPWAFQHANVVQPKIWHTPPMHFCPLARSGQSQSSQHSLQTVGLLEQYLPANAVPGGSKE